GLATLPDGLGIVRGVLGIEHKDDEAELVGEVGKQLMVGAGGFHADAAACRQALEKGPQGNALIRECARREPCLRTGHDDLVLGDIGADVKYFGWGLHDVSPKITIKDAGVEHTCVSLRSNRRS